MIARIVVLLGPALLIGACAGAPRRSATDRAATAACRAEFDRVYAAQNRRDLSFRDQRDAPFASNYNSGIVSAGLGARYGRDTDITACANQTASGAGGGTAPVDVGTGPAFSPVAR